jgi:hypothetical protein
VSCKIDNSVHIDTVNREARRLAMVERSTWQAFMIVLYGRLNPAHVKELIELAEGDVRILDEVRRRIKETTRNASDLRARQLLRRAAMRALRKQPP